MPPTSSSVPRSSRPTPHEKPPARSPGPTGLLQTDCLVFFENLEVVKAAQEEQVGDLLYHFEGVRDSARPEGIPNPIYLVADLAGQHWRPILTIV